MNEINESVLDPIQKSRADYLFNPNDKSETPVILQGPKEFIFGLMEKFKKESDLKFDYVEAFIIGSSLGYQYNDTSDIDVDVRISISADKLAGKYHCIPKGILLPGTAHPVNLFVLTKDDEPFNWDNAENGYDLLTDTWIKQGRLTNADPIPYDYVAGISELFMDGITLQLQRAERDLYTLNKYLKMDPNKVYITEKELNDHISSKISDLLADKDALSLAHRMIFQTEKTAFEGDDINFSIQYVYQDKHFSMANLIYKYIDGFKYFDKINDMIADIDKSIEKAKESLGERKEDSVEAQNIEMAQQEVYDEINKMGAESVAAQAEQQQEQESQADITPEELADGLASGEITEEDLNDAIESGEIPEELAQAAIEILNSASQEEQQVQESFFQYTDKELMTILEENGYAPTLKNLIRVKSGDYIINESVTSEEESLFEDLRKRTENQINRKIRRISGGVSLLGGAGLGFILDGVTGSLVFGFLTHDYNESRKDFTDEVFNAIEDDEDCQNLLHLISEEVKKDDPDKNKLRMYKQQLTWAIKSCKEQVKKARAEYENPPARKIKLEK